MTWSFSLVTLFFNSLPLELQEVVQLEEYTLPDLFSIVAYKTLMDANCRIRKIMATFFHSRNSNANSLITDADCHFQKSLAKWTIRRHSHPGIHHEDRPLVTDKDGKLYLQNPTNQYVSQFVDEFDGCLECGSTQHLFKFSPRKEDKILLNIFFAGNLGSHSFY